MLTCTFGIKNLVKARKKVNHLPKKQNKQVLTSAKRLAVCLQTNGGCHRLSVITMFSFSNAKDLLIPLQKTF